MNQIRQSVIRRHRVSRALVALAIPAVLGACVDSTTRMADSDAKYEASIRRTSYGVAHIQADNFGSLGYGEGYAAAEDHVCNIAYGLLEAAGEKSRYFGPGEENGNIAADATVKALGIPAQARAAFPEQPQTIREWLTGYSAGYNRYLADHPGDTNDSWCSGAPWLVEASVEEFS